MDLVGLGLNKLFGITAYISLPALGCSNFIYLYFIQYSVSTVLYINNAELFMPKLKYKARTKTTDP
jgi:hypothetical protein